MIIKLDVIVLATPVYQMSTLEDIFMYQGYMKK